MSGEMKDMMSQQNRQRAFERLRHLLDVYGGDRDRWPESERLALADFLLHEAEAQRLVRDARLLDLMIEGCELKAPGLPSGGLTLLSDRIVAQARAEKTQSKPGNPDRAKTAPVILRSTRLQMWQAATLMAACLVTGIMVGRSGLVLAPVGQVTEIRSYDETLTGLSPDDELAFIVEEDTI